MIHFLTVHWRSARWIGPQLDYIRRHTRVPYRVVAAVDPSIPAAEVIGRFTSVVTTPLMDHAEKLNLLAETTCSTAPEDDWLVFIDSDCFPIADWVTPVDAYLRDYRLAAVRRDENVGDRQPHPCFAVTTVGFWKVIKGDWRRGHTWRNTDGRELTDVGGNLLGLLEAASIDWKPLLRSNRTDRHAVFFGVYDGIVYHHGAGSRRAHARADMERIKSMVPTWRRRIMHLMGRYDRHVDRQVAITARLGDDLFDQLIRDPDFWRQFVESAPPAKVGAR